MFAGIGGFRAGLDRAGGFQCVGHCEIDKYADASYRAIHDIREEERYYPDARKIDPADLPDFDLLCGGFPCQAFSNAGRRRGFADARGTLFFEIARLAQAKQPQYLLLENVPGLLSHDHGKTFAAILSALDDLGYHVEWTVLNSKHFGVPQSRKRVFLICYLDPRCAGKILPVFGNGGKVFIQLIGGPQGYRVYDSEGVACTQTSGSGGTGAKTGLYLVGFNRKEGITGERTTALSLNASDFRGINRNQTQNAVFMDLCTGYPKQTEQARCLTARYGQTALSNHRAERSGVLLIKEAAQKGRKSAYPGDTVDLGYAGSNTRRRRVGHDIAHTLETSNIQGIVERGGRIRRLMPRECLRLQGFEEDQIDKILAITSDSQAYKQAGNSVTVNVIEAIGRRIRAVDEELRKVGDAA
ncbi:MAG: DNA (cytosine-5-)-methyltransferase [Flavonifractor plautii]|nr:DNA (cytosine-5-)-methyltransferase [Flavonifractor plautii]